MKRLIALFAAVLVMAAHAADGPYDPAADARADIQAALAEAGQSKAKVLVVFGANWCPDCKLLDQALKQGPAAALVARDYKVVKVDVGRFDRNLSWAEAYGVPLKKGIPAVVILSSANEVQYVTRAGELADARRMGEQGIHDFLVKVSPRKVSADTEAGGAAPSLGLYQDHPLGDKASIMFAGVVDTRCPSDATCASAGEAHALFLVHEVGKDSVALAIPWSAYGMHNPKARYRLAAGHRIYLSSLEPRPRMQQRPPADSYTAQLVVQAESASPRRRP